MWNLVRYVIMIISVHTSNLRFEVFEFLLVVVGSVSASVSLKLQVVVFSALSFHCNVGSFILIFFINSLS
jgi:hypothetical protein